MERERKTITWFGIGPHLRVGSVFIPEVVLPDQLGAARKPSPECLLVWAVLEDAVNCLLSGPLLRGEEKVKRWRNCQRETDWQWLNSDDDSPFSFVWVCGVLEMSYVGVRQALVRLVSDLTEQISDSWRICPGCGERFISAISKPGQVFCGSLCKGKVGGDELSVVHWNKGGFCACDCGNQTPPAKYTSLRLGWLVGKPTWYLPGHGKYKIRGKKRHGKRIFEKLGQVWSM